MGSIKIFLFIFQVKKYVDKDSKIMKIILAFEGVKTFLAMCFAAAKIVLFTFCIHAINVYRVAGERFYEENCSDEIANEMLSDYAVFLNKQRAKNESGRIMVIVALCIQFSIMALVSYMKRSAKK